MNNRYVVTRSLSSNSLFNITLVSDKGLILATYATDLEFELAAELVEYLVPPQSKSMTAEENMMKYSKWKEGDGYAQQV